jgi:hypothetical protein
MCRIRRVGDIYPIGLIFPSRIHIILVSKLRKSFIINDGNKGKMDGIQLRYTIQKKFIQWKILHHQTGEKF